VTNTLDPYNQDYFICIIQNSKLPNPQFPFTDFRWITPESILGFHGWFIYELCLNRLKDEVLFEFSQVSQIVKRRLRKVNFVHDLILRLTCAFANPVVFPGCKQERYLKKTAAWALRPGGCRY